MDSKAAIGVVVVFAGLVQVVGAITGNEAAMIAALFSPTLLSTGGGSAAINKPSNIVSGLRGALTSVNGLTGIGGLLP